MKLLIFLSLVFLLHANSACDKSFPEYTLPQPTFSMSSLTDDSAKTWQPYRIEISDATGRFYVNYQMETMHTWDIYQIYMDSNNMDNYRITYSKSEKPDEGYYETTDTISKHLQIPKTGTFRIIKAGEGIGFPGNGFLIRTNSYAEIGHVMVSGYTDTCTKTRHTTTLYYH